MYYATVLLADAGFDRWSDAWSGGFVKGAAIGVVVWLVLKVFRGKSN